MAVKDAALINLGNLSAVRGSQDWIIAVHEEAKAALNDVMVTRESVERWVTALLENNHFRSLKKPDGTTFLLWDDFCATRQPFGLGYSPAAIEALKERRPTASDQAQQAKPLAQQGEIGRGRNRGVVNTSIQRGSSNAEYLTARLARDRPDILERMKAGEFKSVRAAALEAGIVKKRISVPTEPVGLATAIKRHFTYDEIETIIDLLRNG